MRSWIIWLIARGICYSWGHNLPERKKMSHGFGVSEKSTGILLDWSMWETNLSSKRAVDPETLSRPSPDGLRNTKAMNNLWQMNSFRSQQRENEAQQGETKALNGPRELRLHRYRGGPEINKQSYWFPNGPTQWSQKAQTTDPHRKR